MIVPDGVDKSKSASTILVKATANPSEDSPGQLSGKENETSRSKRRICVTSMLSQGKLSMARW